MKDRIKKIFYDYGADVCGIASIDRFCDAPEGFSPVDMYEDCKSVIAFGLAMPRGLLKVRPDLIYAHMNGAIIKRMVDEVALQASKVIEKKFNGLAVPIPCDDPNEYWDEKTLTAKGMISIRHTAVLCGLGQIGKSSMLLNPEYGNLLTVGVVLTNLKMYSDPLCESICIEGCNLCEDNCPVGAIKDRMIIQKLCRSNTYDRTARGFSAVRCNKCRRICPVAFGKREE